MLLDAYYNRNSNLNGLSVNFSDLKSSAGSFKKKKPAKTQKVSVDRGLGSLESEGKELNGYQKSRLTPKTTGLG